MLFFLHHITLWLTFLAQEVTDRTGIFGPLIDHYFGAIVALIQSGGLWLATKASPGWKRTPEPVKWGILYLIGVGLTWLSLKTGFGSEPIEGNALTLAMVLGSVPTLASGLIFKIGGHKVVVVDANAKTYGSGHVA